MSADKDLKNDVHGDPEASSGKLKSKAYLRELARLQVELVKVQVWVQQKGLKVCIVFEGRDGAGKGGVIKAITERVSPRVFRVVALPAPTEREKSQMYPQRHIPHLPAAAAGCGWLGLRLDQTRNARGEGRISADGSAVSAWVIPTDEEQMIARHTSSVLGLSSA